MRPASAMSPSPSTIIDRRGASSLEAAGLGHWLAESMGAKNSFTKQITPMTATPASLRLATLGYLSPRGRITRETYVVRVVAPWVIVGAGLSTVLPRPSTTGFVLMGVLFWAYLAGFAKRLHDLGLPGLPISAVVVISLWVNLQTSLVFPAWLETYLYALFGVGTLFAGSTLGEPRANRYGPDPLAGAHPSPNEARS